MNTSRFTLYEIYEMPKFSSVGDILSPHAEFVKTLMHMVNLSGFQDSQNSHTHTQKRIYYLPGLLISFLHDILQQRFSCWDLLLVCSPLAAGHLQRILFLCFPLATCIKRKDKILLDSTEVKGKSPTSYDRAKISS